MTTTLRHWILRANALYLALAALGGLLFMDLPGIYLGRGPARDILSSAPHAGIGFVEAHGLAFILGVLLWRAAPARVWHVTALAVEVLLGTANLVFWQLFIVSDTLAVGYITTSLHWLFAMLQIAAVMTSNENVSDPSYSWRVHVPAASTADGADALPRQHRR